ncbi:hypothetical protein BDDG_12213, partial [Blastomyces dermatitidis ATCC 18188]
LKLTVAKNISIFQYPLVLVYDRTRTESIHHTAYSIQHTAYGWFGPARSQPDQPPFDSVCQSFDHRHHHHHHHHLLLPVQSETSCAGSRSHSTRRRSAVCG